MLARLSRHAEAHSRLMRRMMDRLGTDERPGTCDDRALAAAVRRCLWCRSERRCAAWLDEPSPCASPSRPPDFCPNGELFAAGAASR